MTQPTGGTPSYLGPAHQALMQQLGNSLQQQAGAPGLIQQMLSNPDLAKSTGGFSATAYTPDMPSVQRVDWGPNFAPGGLLNWANWGGMINPAATQATQGGSTAYGS